MTITAHEIRKRVLAGETSCVAATREAIAAAEASSPLGAFLQVLGDEAIVRASKLDAMIASDRAAAERLPLLGVPVAIKDNICFEAGNTTAASKLLADYRSPFSATAVKRLVDAGAVIIGKTNMDEFGMGSSGENSAFGPTRNPWETDRVPGGSSSGSAAAVAAGVVPVALGSDTGGSIRQPASHCGVVGFKPTYGRVSRYGLIAYASSLDQIGTLTRSVADAASSLAAISGIDPHDATSSTRPVPAYASECDQPIAGLRIGVPAQARSSANDPRVTKALEKALSLYQEQGATIVDIELPTIDYAIAAYYIVATAEASSNLARFDGVRYGKRATLGPGEGLMELYCKSRAEGFGPEVKKRIMLGTHVLSSGYYDAYYATAMKARRKIKGDFDAVFAENGPACHVIMMPASPGPAFKLGEKTTDPLAMYLEDAYTVPVNLAGLPAVTVPVDGPLPIGVQLIGPAFGESTLLRAASMLERVTGWSGRTALLASAVR